MLSTVLSLFLAGVPPIAPISAELEICILKAELCAARVAPLCEKLDEPALAQCIEGYEDCAYGLPGWSEPSCQTERVWCALESPYWIAHNSNEETVKYCAEVAEFCPAY